MNDLKEFWDKEIVAGNYEVHAKYRTTAIKYNLGLFFWESIREDIVDMNMLEQAKKEEWDFNFENIKLYYEQDMSDNQIGLKWKYCVACLGENKVKELIKKEGGKNNEF